MYSLKFKYCSVQSMESVAFPSGVRGDERSDPEGQGVRVGARHWEPFVFCFPEKTPFISTRYELFKHIALQYMMCIKKKT